MSLDPALEKTLADMKGISPYVVAAKSGCDFSQGRFTIPFFQQTFYVYYPELKVVEAGKESPASPILSLVLYHYLLTADGTGVADFWTTYRFLPGAHLFAERIEGMATRPLLRAFGKDIEAFRKAGLALGGIPMNRTGDAAFRFLALPNIPIACVLYLGDEEVPPSLSLLFDESAAHYLPTEDLTFLGVYLGQGLRRAARKE